MKIDSNWQDYTLGDGIWNQTTLTPNYYSISDEDYSRLTKMIEEAEEYLSKLNEGTILSNINVHAYGIRLIKDEYGRFVYEAVLLDPFPEDFESLFVSYLNEEHLENVEEIELLKLTDTCIVFSTSTRLPDDLTDIVIQCN